MEGEHHPSWGKSAAPAVQAARGLEAALAVENEVVSEKTVCSVVWIQVVLEVCCAMVRCRVIAFGEETLTV